MRNVDKNVRLLVNSTEGEYATNDFETITVSSTATGLTTAKIDDNTSAFITVETSSIRIRVDGTAPTTSVGHLVLAGETIELQGSDELDNFSAIATSTDATISVSYKDVD